MSGDQPKIGLVLGAGGVPGGAYIRGALAEIETLTGWVPATAHTIVGTSIGALNAARLPMPDQFDPATEAQLDKVARLGSQLRPPSAGPAVKTAALLRFLGGRAVTLFSPAGSHPQDYGVADPPYHPGVIVVSVQRRRGQRRAVRLAESASPAAELYASAAVPGFIAPVDVDGEQRIDGAVWSSTNADLISPDNHDGLVVVAPMAARTGGNLLARSHWFQLLTEITPWMRSGKPLLVVSPTGDEQLLRPDHSAFARSAIERVRG